MAAVNGTATFANLSVDKSGIGYTLVASSGALSPATSTPFEITTRLLVAALPTTGAVTVAMAGGGAACTFAAGGYVPVTGGAASPPAGSAPSGYAFPYGLVNFTATSCTGTITLTYTFPGPLLPDAVFWKYGPTELQQDSHWYVMPAVISGNTLTVTIADGGLGDDDLKVNGTIVDPAGVGFAIVDATPVPTLRWPALLLLALLLTAASTFALSRKPR